MAKGREKKKLGKEVEQMDLDTFEMSPEKRAFTVECVDMNANAPGRHSHSRKYKILSLFSFSVSLSILFSLPGFTLLTHPE